MQVWSYISDELVCSQAGFQICNLCTISAWPASSTAEEAHSTDFCYLTECSEILSAQFRNDKSRNPLHWSHIIAYHEWWHICRLWGWGMVRASSGCLNISRARRQSCCHLTDFGISEREWLSFGVMAFSDLHSASPFMCEACTIM